jgi:hypothetical protein
VCVISDDGKGPNTLSDTSHVTLLSEDYSVYLNPMFVHVACTRISTLGYIAEFASGTGVGGREGGRKKTYLEMAGRRNFRMQICKSAKVSQTRVLCFKCRAMRW